MGRKLDALVAEKVMGWTRVERAVHDVWLMDESDIDSLITREPTSYGSFKPSENIAAAWRAVDKMFEHPDQEVYLAFRHYLSLVGHISPSHLMPTRVCVAALRAVGVPEAEIQEAVCG